MSDSSAKRKVLRRVLYVILGLAVLVLAGAIALIVPILSHESAGSSGQVVPEGFVSSTSAVGADNRTRTLSVLNADGSEADLAQITPGDELLVRGTGFDSSIGIYVSICLVPSLPNEKPSPCLGGLPEGAIEGEAAGDEQAMSSVWITDDWAWRAFATKSYDVSETGSFETQLLVPAASQDGLDCTVSLCAVTTRADHTAANDRVQDMLLPVAFAR